MTTQPTHEFPTASAAMTAINVLGAFGITAGMTHRPGEARPWFVTITRWPFTPRVALVPPQYDPQPHEDDFQESRQWDQGWDELDVGYRRRHSLNDPD